VIGANGFHSSLAMRPATDGRAVTVMDRRRVSMRIKLYRHAFSRCHASNFLSPRARPNRGGISRFPQQLDSI
jgi:hypothetical protein